MSYWCHWWDRSYICSVSLLKQTILILYNLHSTLLHAGHIARDGKIFRMCVLVVRCLTTLIDDALKYEIWRQRFDNPRGLKFHAKYTWCGIDHRRWHLAPLFRTVAVWMRGEGEMGPHNIRGCYRFYNSVSYIVTIWDKSFKYSWHGYKAISNVTLRPACNEVLQRVPIALGNKTTDTKKLSMGRFNCFLNI